MLIDSHAHLIGLSDSDFDSIVSRSAQAGVTTIINVGTNLDSSIHVLNKSYGDENITIYPAVGICPPEIHSAPDNWEEKLNVLITENSSIIAIGEIGIDGSNPTYPPMDEQLPFFTRQLEIARDNDLPAIVHARGVESEALDICKKNSVTKAIFHCFTGTLEEAVAIVEAGYIVSFSGIVTFKNSDFDEIINAVPANQLLLETDSPYLAPVPYRGKTNEPSYVSEIYRYCAEVRGVSLDQLAQSCRDTFNELFSLS